MTPETSSARRACPAYADLLVDFSDGDMTEQERRPVAAHVASCAGCRAELKRLDASLERLKRSWHGAEPVTRAGRRAHDWRAPAAAALASLACLAGLSWVVWQLATSDAAPAVARVAAAPHPPPAARVPGPPQEEVFRRIALIEQQARLQTSLDLMPHEAWFSQQRATNEKLLVIFKAAADDAPPATEASTKVAPSTRTAPSTGETL